MTATQLSDVSGYTTYIFLGAVLVGAIVSACHVSQRPISRLPGPWISKWTGIVLTYYWLTGRQPLYVHYLHEKYGSVVRISPNEVGVSDLTAARQIHAFKGGFLKSAWYQELTVANQRTIFNAIDIEFHRRHRRLLSNPMSESYLKLLEPVIQERARLAISRIGEEMQARGAADVFRWWLFMATDIIGELTFGESFRMLDIGKKNQYIHDLENLAKLSSLRATFPGMTKFSRDVFPLPLFNRIVQIDRRTMAYAEESIRRYKRHVAAEPNPKPTLFSKMFRPGDESLTDNEIRDDAQAYIVAGSDTTANSLTYLIWAVCRDQDVKAKLLEEINDVPEQAASQDLKALSYLNQVIEETLRLYTAVPAGLPRAVPPGGVNMAGYYISAGTTVSTQAYSLHRNPDIFPNPEKFDPSRWVAPTKAMTDSFMAFGAGSRVCLGMHLARMELRLGTVLFFRAFPNARVSTMENMNEEDMEGQMYFLLAPKGGRCLIQSS